MKYNLSEMLSYMRPASSVGEQMFIERYLLPVPGIQIDDFGNYFVKIGESRTMFSSHTDTVHNASGRQAVFVDPVLDHAFVSSKDSNCLGADDTAGIYIMLRMIEAGVPGLYVFHREEETGGGGSLHFSSKMAKGEYDRCIAFDRKGYGDVITQQAASTCCSDKFADALCDALGEDFLPSERGVFTDSANYTHIIPECTNISVGYFDAHTSKEWLDMGFVRRLTDICIAVNWEALPVVREAKHDEYPGWRTSYGSGGGLYSGRDWNGKGGWTTGSFSKDELSYNQCLKIVEMEPGLAAEMLYQMRATKEDFDLAMETYYEPQTPDAPPFEADDAAEPKSLLWDGEPTEINLSSTGDDDDFSPLMDDPDDEDQSISPNFTKPVRCWS